MSDSSLPPIQDLSGVENPEQYLRTGRVQVVRVLRELAERPDVITAYFNQGSRQLLTAVLEVRADRNLLVLDQGPNERVNQQAVETDRLLCVTQHNRVSVKFSCTGLQRARSQGHPVFACPIPESVYYLQRREFFRVPLPHQNPVLCRIPRDGGDPLELPVLDIGVGGLALLDAQDRLPLEPLEELRDCGIHLPFFGFVVLNLQVRYRKDAGIDGKAKRIGCAFLPMDMGTMTLLQRFLHKTQLELNGIHAH